MNAQRRARRTFGHALAVGAAVALASAALMPASALGSSEGAHAAQTVQARHQLVFECKEVLSDVPQDVAGKSCTPPLVGAIRQEFVIWTGAPGAPRYVCQFGYANSPDYVIGRNCEVHWPYDD